MCLGRPPQTFGHIFLDFFGRLLVVLALNEAAPASRPRGPSPEILAAQSTATRFCRAARRAPTAARSGSSVSSVMKVGSRTAPSRRAPHPERGEASARIEDAASQVSMAR